MAEWMNQIGVAIESHMPGICKYNDGGVEHIIPQREWTSLHSDTPLPSASPYGIK